jgi:hypothetical protein
MPLIASLPTTADAAGGAMIVEALGLQCERPLRHGAASPYGT